MIRIARTPAHHKTDFFKKACVWALFFSSLGSMAEGEAGVSESPPAVTVYNYHQQAVYAWPVKLDHDQGFYTGLGSREALQLSTIPRNDEAPHIEWRTPKITAWMPEEWRQENTYGKIANGALEITLQKQRIHIGVPRIQGTERTPFVHPMVSPLVFSGKIDGRPGRFSTELFSDIQGRAYLDQGWAVMEIRKDLDEAGKGIACLETFRLHPEYPVFDYALSFSNRTGKVLEFVLTHASGAAQVFYAGEFLEGRKVLHCDRKKMRSGVLDDSKAWISVQSRFLNPSAWAVVEDDGGYFLGVSTRGRYGSLFGAETKWIFPENRMVLDLPYEEPEAQNGRPIVLYPDRPVETGIRLYVLPPAAGRPQEIGAAFRDHPAGEDLRFASPFTVYCGSEPVEFAAMDSLEDLHRAPRLWCLGRGRVIEHPSGMKMIVEQGVAEASVAAKFPADRPLTAEVSFLFLDPGVTAELLLVRRGEPPESLAVWREPGTQSVDLPIANMPLEAQWIIRVQGDDGSGAVLNGFRVGIPLPPAPQLVFPVDGATHIPAGVSFRWQPVSDVLLYDLEIAASPEFKDAIRHTIEYTAKEALFGRPDRGAPGDAGFFPSERLMPGVWYWRTRAVAHHAAGKWSSPRMFSVRAPSGATRLRFDLSPTNILFCSSFHVGQSAAVLDQASRAASPELRDNVVNRLVLETVRSAREQSWDALFDSIAQADARFMIQPGHSGLDLSLFETALQQCPNLIGFCQGELFWGFWDFPDRREVARRILEISAEYGSWFLWGDGQEGAYNWFKLLEDPEWRQALDRFGDHLIPTWKMNLLTGQFTTQGAVLGMQIDGEVLYTGAWPESFYWSEVGFGPAVGDFFGRQKGETKDMPDPFWIQNYLLGVAQGAVAFVNHDPALLWSSDGKPTETWTRQFQPFFEFLDQVAPPPDQESLQKQSRKVQIPAASSLEYHENYGPFAALYQTLYGVKPGRELIELIPDRSDYIPVALVRREESGGVPLMKLTDRESVEKRFPSDSETLAVGMFPAWLVQDKARLLAMNPSENTPGMAGFKVRLGRDKGLILEGMLDVHGYLMAMETEGGTEFLVNGRSDGGSSAITFLSDRVFTVEIQGGQTLAGGPGNPVRVLGEPATFPLRMTWVPGDDL